MSIDAGKFRADIAYLLSTPFLSFYHSLYFFDLILIELYFSDMCKADEKYSSIPTIL